MLHPETTGVPLWQSVLAMLVLGTCPTLAMTKNVGDAFGMGLAALAVLVCSNILVSLLRKIIPDTVRIPSYIVIIASFVTIVQMIVKAFLPELNENLGVFLPLITVNCIILGRAEMFAGKNSVGRSALDGIGMGLGFTLALTLIGMVREVLGSGSIFGLDIWQGDGALIFILSPGAFFVLGYLMVIFRKLTAKTQQ